MSDEVARITIEMRFGKGLTKSVNKAKSGGEDVTVESVINDLAEIYRKTLSQTPQFTNPLKALDKKVKITVKGEV